MVQVGRHANVVEAARAATAADGGGLFRGTAALLSREVPFYMFGGPGPPLQRLGRNRLVILWATSTLHGSWRRCLILAHPLAQAWWGTSS